jgi:hypothetical protein
MSHATSARRPLAVRAGANLTAALGTIGAFLAMTLAHWPGLIKIAGLLAVAFALICRQEWREAAETRRHAHLAGLAALAGTALLALLWPLALPGEQLATIGIVAGLAIAHSVNVELVLAHVRRAGR